MSVTRGLWHRGRSTGAAYLEDWDSLAEGCTLVRAIIAASGRHGAWIDSVSVSIPICYQAAAECIISLLG